MLLPGRGDSEEPTGEATAVPAMTGNDRRAERASNDEPDGTAQATTGLTTLPLAHLSVGLTRKSSATAGGSELGCAYLLSGRNLWAPILAHGISDTLCRASVVYGLGELKRKRHEHIGSNQTMKPTAPLRNAFSVFATTPCRGLSLSR